MVEQALHFDGLAPNVQVKFPATAAGIAADLSADDAAKATAAAEAQRVAESHVTLVDDARSAVATSEQANRVAAIAGDHQPGDDCPVCAQVLPDGFHVAGGGDLESAKRELADAVKAQQSADAAAREASNEHIAVEERASNASKQEAGTAAAVIAARTRTESLGVDTAAGNESEALSHVLLAAGTAKAGLDTAAGEERNARSEVDAAEATLRSRFDS